MGLLISFSMTMSVSCKSVAALLQSAVMAKVKACIFVNQELKTIMEELKEQRSPD